MVYVASDGTICENPPWNLDRIIKILHGVVSFVILFFKTLIGLDNGSKPFGSGSGRSSQGGGWFRGSGGGGGGGGGGGSGGRPYGPGGGGGGPSRRIMTMRDINPPRVGGCPGGACGL